MFGRRDAGQRGRPDGEAIGDRTHQLAVNVNGRPRHARPHPTVIGELGRCKLGDDEMNTRRDAIGQHAGDLRVERNGGGARRDRVSLPGEPFRHLVDR